LRHAFITAALDAGVPLRDVPEAASHADPRTTMRYDRARTLLDRHATYIAAAYVAEPPGKADQIAWTARSAPPGGLATTLRASSPGKPGGLANRRYALLRD
jgi:hypothetical protein